MAKSSKGSSQGMSEFEFLQGGKPPEGALKGHLAELKKNMGSEMREKLEVQQQAAKYLSQINPPAAIGDGAKATQAMNGLRAITDRIAKQKLVTPRFPIPPISVWGTYTLQFTPPSYLIPDKSLGSYLDGEISSETGNPTASATGNEQIGQMTCMVATDYNAPSAATASNTLGVAFKPRFAEATVRITFQSQIAFWWYVNSIHSKESTATAQGLIELYEYDGAFVRPALRRGAFIGFGIVGLNDLDFDVVNEAGPTWALEAPVTSSLWYFIVISLTVSASGTGWPGGLAGVNASVTVPSITASITANPVVSLPNA
jgi:hypothetical protein